ncbi:class I SAM-dependent methyltransferase [Sulfurimonas sp.]|nr:class I SAM-dependent methyltransferase [Sulfurimonas sp.]
MPKINNEKFYTSAIEMYGTSPKGVNWNSKESQETRFHALLSLLPKNLNKYSLSDAGCGFGDLYTYMSKKDRLPKEYIGIDTLEDMYSIASNKTGCEIIIADICKDTLPHTDFYLCSGALNVLNEFETHLFISNCFSTCKYGFVFNILHGDKTSETYNYFTKEKIEKIAKELHVEKVVFKTGYLENDISVGFFKQEVS